MLRMLVMVTSLMILMVFRANAYGAALDCGSVLVKHRK